MKRSTLCILILSLILMLRVSTTPSFHMKNNRIYDSTGGERIFHGLNIVIKVPPYYTNKINWQKLKNYGINGIRLGVMWPGVQPKQDTFNSTYLDIMVNIVNQAGKYNIFTLIQFHQDLFSQKFCGDGVPMWAIPKDVYHSFPIPLSLFPTNFDNNTGLPNPSVCASKPWAEFYSTKAVNRGFGHLWKNKNGLLNKFATYWKTVAKAFKGNPFVIGYQLMNQPWPGNMYENPLIMVPQLSQQFHLQQAYDFLAHEIRSVDPGQNICYQPVTWLNNFRSGFTHPPQGHRFANSSIFCYHYYNPPTIHLNIFMKARMRDVKRLGGGGMLTEFYTQGSQGVKNVNMMSQCDAHSQSWFGWIYEQNLIPQIKRTFSHRVAGSIISQSFNNITKQYNLMYRPDPIAGNTLVYLDTKWDYKQGFDVRIYPTLSKAKYNLVDNMYLSVNSNQFPEGIIAMIVITQ